MKTHVLLSILLLLMMSVIHVFKTSAASTILAANPPNSYVTIAKTLNVDVNVTDVINLTSWQFTMYFLNSVLNCTGVVEGPFLKTGGGTFFGKAINNNYNSTHGSVLAYSTLLGTTDVDGSGILATITFDALAVGDTPLHLSDTKLGNEIVPPEPIDHTTVDGTVHVQNFVLTVTTVGSGSVTLNNTGPYYHYGEALRLTAVPAIGWSFSVWSGDLTGSTNPATLVVTGNVSVTATFTQDQYVLSISYVGSGSVSKSPNQATYTWGTNVTLTATATIGWSFAGWSGDASGTTNPTVVNMTANKAVTATFTQNVYTLTVTPVGSGTVTLNNTGPYRYGDTVVLTASGLTGWVFHYWTGDLTGSANPATIIMTGNFSVTAHFALKPTLQMTPSNKTCRVINESFTVTVSVSNAVNVEDFAFEIHYNTTLLDYVSITWNAWGPGIITVDESNGILTGYASGTPLNGTQTLITIGFKATLFHIWKGAPGWTNNLTDTIFFQKANISYPIGPDLRYEKGGLSQITVGSDFVYTFAPIQGDVNNDGNVDLFDLRTVAAYFAVKQEDPSWPEASTYDLDGNEIIDVFDLRVVAANYGYAYVP